MKDAYVSDLALTLLKSTPSNVTLDKTNEELFIMNSSLLEARDVLKPVKVEMLHQSLWLAYPNNITKKRCFLDGEIKRWTRYFGIATLVGYPQEFQPEKQRYNECPISLDLDFHVLKQDGFVINDNNFVSQIATCRALYSWMTVEELMSPQPLILERETQTGLPPGDYVFRITTVAYVGSYESVEHDTKVEAFGEYAHHDWATRSAAEHLSRKELSWDPHEYQILDHLQQKNVTVRLSRSTRHTTSGSVDTKKGKGKKEKATQEQDSPGLQLG